MNQPNVADILQEDEGTTYDFSELYEALLKQRDVILTIPKDQVDALKKGLSSKKSKESAKQRSAGLAISRDAFEYLVYDDPETQGTENIKVRVKLGPRTNITVLKMEIPDDAL